MAPFRKRTIRKAKKSYKRFLKKQAKKRTVGLIKRVVRSQEEKKAHQATTNTFYMANPVNTTGFSAQNIWELTQNANLDIVQGTGQANRIGNKIRIASAWLKVILAPNAYDATYNSRPVPQDVRLILFKLKGQTRTLAQAQTVWSTTGSCFQSNNTSTGLEGDLSDMFRLINNDVVSVEMDRIIKLGASSYEYTGAATAGHFFGNNNDYKYNVIKRINLMRNGFPRIWRYNDTSASPFGFNPLFAVWIPVDATGAAAYDTTNARPVQVTYQIDVKFTDA